MLLRSRESRRVCGCSRRSNADVISDPELIYDKARTGEEGFDGALELFPQNFSLKQVQPELSGKFKIVRYHWVGTRET